ncbi:hypothetical protein HOC54_02755, partial [Candidatus Peregrinibacteria bacterium]|nr:hypothetical protein [Candidatus Peregrinibacteria bacterium]
AAPAPELAPEAPAVEPAAAPEVAPAPELAPEAPAVEPAAAPEVAPAPELAPEALVPETPVAPESSELNVKTTEIVKPTSAILDGEPEGQKTADDGFFKKNKTMIMGGVVALIVITVIVGIVLSIGNSDKLEGRLEMLKKDVETEAVQAPAKEEELPTKAPTVNPNVTPTTSRAEPDTQNYPNIVSLYAVK